MKSNFLKRLIFIIFSLPLVILSLHFGGYYFYFLVTLVSLIGLYEIFLLKKKIFSFIIFILFSIFLFLFIEIYYEKNGKIYIYLLLLITWLSDTGGYIIGRYLGKKKISYISPNKTYLGFLGSIIFSQLSFFYLFFNDTFFFNSLFITALLLIFSSLIVIFGDLFFSYIKRKCKIKDYSNIFIGHGGLFDRIDGLIFLTFFLKLVLIIS